MTVIIQPGAFNPAHAQHLAISKDARLRYPQAHYKAILAKQSCDKGYCEASILEVRGEALKGQGMDYRIVESGLFVDIIRLFKEEGYDKIILAVGEDTIYRFFRDWSEFYVNKPRINPYLEYREIFKDVEWYITRRDCSLLKDLAYLKKITEDYTFQCNVVWSDLPMDDISSTKIRAGLINNEL